MMSPRYTIVNNWLQLMKIIWIILLVSITVQEFRICNAAPSVSGTLSALVEQRKFNLPIIGGSTSSSSSGGNNEETNHIANLTRQHNGDVFTANGMSKCNLDTCVGLSSGTAGLFISDTKVIISGKSDEQQHPAATSATNAAAAADDDDICNCRCHSHESTYREDLGICVDDIRECTLSPFISGSSTEKIPFVFLPLRGQIIYPSREISFPDIRTPICAVTGSQYLTTNGWSDLRNPIDSDFPFRMFRDEGRTFLQWLGEPDLRYKMQGRLILIHLMCRDMSFPANLSLLNNDENPPFNKLAKNIFSPCVAFRINGSPVKYFHNVSEVLFQSENTSSNLSANSIDGLSTREYIVIGICSLLLGLIYVASVFLYIHMKKRKNLTTTSTDIRNNNHLDDDLDNNDINYPKNDQVTFGIPFTRTGSSYSGTSRNNINNNNDHHHRSNSQRSLSTAQQQQQQQLSHNLNGNGTTEEMGIIKSNPLLKHFPNLSDHSGGFTSDLSNSNSECEDNNNHTNFNDRIMMNNTQTAVIVHPSNSNSNNMKLDLERNHANIESPPSPTQENECLPEENVSIVEDMGADEKLETMRALVSGTIRKKLYFNPAYFEPQLLMSPPPAAIEFLTKIREVIAIAKYKMATKRYQPSLIMIPEECQLNDSEQFNTNNNTQGLITNNYTKINSTTIQMNSVCVNNCSTAAATITTTTTTNNNSLLNKCGNCGDKRNSIEKWLETVPIHENNNNVANQQRTTNVLTTSTSSTTKNEEIHKEPEVQTTNEKNSMTKLTNESNSIKNKIITAPKTKPPPIPTTAPPKIISHSLKTNLQNIHPLKYEQNNRPTTTQPQPPKDPPPQIPLLNQEPPISVIRHNSGSSNNNIYKFVTETAALNNEIYNNPKFNHLDSPQLSLRSHTTTTSSSHRSRGKRKKIEILDQYANPPQCSNEREHYEMLRRNMKQMPDMVYEALAKDYSMGMYSGTITTPTTPELSELNGIQKCTNNNNYNIPTPDYDSSTFDKKMKDIYNNTTQSSAPSVPTPDYSTLGKKPLRQYQPDSPIYRRKSPQYLIVDYETDSLERTTTTHTNSTTSNHRKCTNSLLSSPSSSSNNSSDLSSQPSPSLSTALPMEEEVEIRHTVYDKVEGFRKDGESNIKKKVTRTNNEYEDIHNKENHKKTILTPRIIYDRPFRGSMTIEVQHEPLSDLDSTDSDQFEPDTLDRKPKKHSFCDVKNLNNAWSEHLKKSKNFVNNIDGKVSYSSLENMTSLPDFSTSSNNNNNNNVDDDDDDIKNQLILRSSSSFRSNIETSPYHYHTHHNNNMNNNNSNYESMSRCASEKNHNYYQHHHNSINNINNKSSFSLEGRPSFGSLREIYQSKTQRHSHRPKLTNINFIEQGRLLTLEAKHSKRQRKNLLDDKIQKIMPPDVVPSLPIPETTGTVTAVTAPVTTVTTVTTNSNKLDNNNYYDIPKFQNNNNLIIRKNCKGWNINDFNKLNINNNCSVIDDIENTETTSSHSESTEITGVSDTQANSEFEDETCNNHKSLNSKIHRQKSYDISTASSKHSANYNGIYKKKPKESIMLPLAQQNHRIDLRGDYSFNKYLSRKKSINDDEKFDLTKPIEQNHKKISVTSSELSPVTYATPNKTSNIIYPDKMHPNIQTIYRVEVNNQTNGMQIAMGLRDRAKKTKDLKNAWKKFVSLATSKFHSSNHNYNKNTSGQSSKDIDIKSTTTNTTTDASLLVDEGIASLIDDSLQIIPTTDDIIQHSNTNQLIDGTGGGGGGGGGLSNNNFILTSINHDTAASHINNNHNLRTQSTGSSSYYDSRFGQKLEMDSGYMSADSNEVYTRRCYERYNFKLMTEKDHIITIDTIEDHSDDYVGDESQHSSIKNKSFEHHHHHHSNDLNLKKNMNNVDPEMILDEIDRQPIEVNVYSTDDDDDDDDNEDEENSNSRFSFTESDEDGGGNTAEDNMSESGAESVETHSVLFKNIRKNHHMNCS